MTGTCETRGGRRRQAGRTRAVVLVTLVLLIGVLGAILLPRLLDDGVREGPLRASASVCFVTGDAGAPRGGTIRLVARRTGVETGLLDTEDPVAEHQDAVSIATFLADDAVSVGWRAAREDACIYLDDLDEVGGSPGRTGVGMALGLSVDASRGAAFRVRVAEGRPDTSRGGRFTDEGPVEEPRREGPDAGTGRLVLSVGASADEAKEATGTAVEVVVPYDLAAGPEAVHAALTRALGRAGFTYDLEADAPHGVVLRRRPDGRAIGSLLLTLGGADAARDAKAEPHPLLFSVGLARE